MHIIHNSKLKSVYVKWAYCLVGGVRSNADVSGLRMHILV